MTSPVELSLCDAAERIRSRELSSREVTAACVERIDRHAGALNCFIRFDPDEALAQADAADRALAAGDPIGPPNVCRRRAAARSVPLPRDHSGRRPDPLPPLRRKASRQRTRPSPPLRPPRPASVPALDSNFVPPRSLQPHRATGARTRCDPSSLLLDMSTLHVCSTRMHATDVAFVLQGIAFVWDDDKARTNPRHHDGITFEQAAEAFFDPF